MKHNGVLLHFWLFNASKKKPTARLLNPCPKKIKESGDMRLLVTCAAVLGTVLEIDALLDAHSRYLFPRRPLLAAQQRELTDLEYYVMRRKGTERSFSSPLNDEERSGEYRCRACGTTLFASQHKFDSKTGWPSFDASTDQIATRPDVKWPIVFALLAITFVPAVLEQEAPSWLTLAVCAYALRLYAYQTEIYCEMCDAHVGHVFNDGPRETTGRRFCCNGVALTFHPGTEDSQEKYGSPEDASEACLEASDPTPTLG